MYKSRQKVNNSKTVLRSAAYIFFSLVFIISEIVLTEDLGIWCNTPRKLQFAWIASILSITLWKIIGFYFVRNCPDKIKILAAIFVSAGLFWGQYSVLDKVKAIPSMLMVTLLILGAADAIMIMDKFKIKMLLLIAGYLAVGIGFLYCRGVNVLSWDRNYSVFSHIYMLVICLLLYFSLTGRKIKIANAYAKIMDTLKID